MPRQSSLKCQDCGNLTETELADHLARDHDLWRCLKPSCKSQLIKGYDNLKAHVKKEHPKLDKVLCNMCDKESKSFADWCRHASQKYRGLSKDNLRETSRDTRCAAVEDDDSTSTSDGSEESDDDSGDSDDNDSEDTDGGASLQSSSSSAGTKTVRAKRTINELRYAMPQQARRNGVALFKASKELEGNRHVTSIEQRIILTAHKETKDGQIRNFQTGTKPLSSCKRAKETKMINKIIEQTTRRIAAKYTTAKGELTVENMKKLQLEATGNLFQLKTKSDLATDSNGERWNVGLKMIAGHLGNEKLGQVGRDANLIVKTQSCNLKYSAAFETPLKRFIDHVVEIDPRTEAYVKVKYIVPEYRTLVHTDKSGESLEIPFAPKFNVQFSLENNKNPDIQSRFDDEFEKLRPAGKKSGGIYSISFSNDYPSKMTLLQDGYLPPDPTSREIIYISNSLKSIKLS